MRSGAAGRREFYFVSVWEADTVYLTTWDLSMLLCVLWDLSAILCTCPGGPVCVPEDVPVFLRDLSPATRQENIGLDQFSAKRDQDTPCRPLEMTMKDVRKGHKSGRQTLRVENWAKGRREKCECKCVHLKVSSSQLVCLILSGQEFLIITGVFKSTGLLIVCLVWFVQKSPVITGFSHVFKLTGLLSCPNQVWFGQKTGQLTLRMHLKEMDRDKWPKRILTLDVEGPNPCGRPRRKWFDNIKEDLHHLNLDKINPQDRDKWRAAIKPQMYCASTSNPRKMGNNRR
ncbi:hypothetical protein Bbelb_260760 [Branchiostoma belcheri]|nr:hypothetical protein Bbelb_260760 [Branchiostoma belcheri]